MIEDNELVCPLGHPLKNQNDSDTLTVEVRSTKYHYETTKAHLSICDKCGVVFDLRLANKEYFKKLSEKLKAENSKNATEN